MFKIDRNLFPDAVVKHDPFSLAAFMAWLETKDPNEEYCWSNSGHCLFAQYGAHLGGKTYFAVMDGWRDAGLSAVLGFYNNKLGVASCQPHTFGAALERTKAARARAYAQKGAL